MPLLGTETAIAKSRKPRVPSKAASGPMFAYQGEAPGIFRIGSAPHMPSIAKVSSGEKQGEAQCNARLMAAAWVLRDAAQEAVDVLPAAHPAAIALRAALAEANGQ